MFRLFGRLDGFRAWVFGRCGGWITAIGEAVGFKSRCLRQLGSRLAKFLCFGFLRDQMGFRVGRLVGVEVGLRHLGK